MCGKPLIICTASLILHRNGNNTGNIIFNCLPDILYVWHEIKYEICSFAAFLGTACMKKAKPVPCNYQSLRHAAAQELTC